MTPIPTVLVSVLPEDEINDDDPTETQVQDAAHDNDHQDEDNDKDDSTIPEAKDHWGRHNILKQITEDDEKEMLEHNGMLIKLLFEQEAKWMGQRTRMLTKLDRFRTVDRPVSPGIQSKIFQLIDPLWYYGEARKLDNFLETLKSNFASHKHLFPRGDPNQVMYAVSVPDTWSNHPVTTQWPMEN